MKKLHLLIQKLGCCNLTAKNWVLFISLFSFSFSAVAQTASNNASFYIKDVLVKNETSFGRTDGAVSIVLNSVNSGNAKFKVTYDLHAQGNKFTLNDLGLTGNMLVLNGLRGGKYINLTVENSATGKKAVWSQEFTVQSANAVFVPRSNQTNSLNNPPTPNLACSGQINFTSCDGSSAHTPSSYNSGKAYNVTSNGTTCGYEISATCTVTNIYQWQCIDGNRSAPPVGNEYSITNYAGVGLTALQACRVNWVICNNSTITSSVSAAIWQICGTGGSANSIYNSAVAAVPVANGAEANMVFYNSGNTSYQRMVKYNCSASLFTLGNRVWYDSDPNNGANAGNNNGINESAENGIKAVTVNLYNDANGDNVPDGAAIATTVTDANGYYSFSNLAAGKYIVGAVTPAGYMKAFAPASGSTPTNNTDLDNNGITTSGIETIGHFITLATGGPNPNNTYDIAFVPQCPACPAGGTGNLLTNGSFESGTTGWSWNSATGNLTTGTGYIACGLANGFNNWTAGAASTVYQDVTAIAVGSILNFSAYAGTHTPGISCSPTLSLIFLNSANAVIKQKNVTVTRDVDVNFSQLAYYAITDTVPTGAVKVRVQSSITCNTMKMDAFVLCSTPPPANASIGDYVWLDANKNGVQDAGEAGIPNVTVQLKNSAGTVIATTSTSSTGFYLFSGLAAGNYTVTFPVTLSGGSFSGAQLASQYAGTDPTKDSDPNTLTGITAMITLAAGENNLTVDAGYLASCAAPSSPYYFPDNDVTYKNKHVSSNVATNDQMPPNTYYGTTPTLKKSPANSHPTLLMSASGVYDFVSDVVGRYEFDIPVCVPGAPPVCKNSILQIIVLDSGGTVTNPLNPPVASIDAAVTLKNTQVILNTLSNDRPGNLGGSLSPSSVMIIAPPLHGTTSINGLGQNTYNPTTGYVGNDTLKYKVCEIGGGCDTSYQIIFILDTNVPNSTFAADDYNTTKQNFPVMGNAKSNDFDPEGDSAKILAQTVTVPNTGTLVLASNGNYTFTPVPSFFGDANIPYTICDSVTAPRIQKCAVATIHIKVYPAPPLPDFTPLIRIDSVNFRNTDTLAVNTRATIINIEEVSDLFGLGNASVGQVQFIIRKMTNWDITFNPTATSVLLNQISEPVKNNDWAISQSPDSLSLIFTLKPGVVIAGNGRSMIGVNLQRKPKTPVNTFQEFTIIITTNSGGDNQPFNNAASTYMFAGGRLTNCAEQY